MLYNLSLQGTAPKMFGKLSKKTHVPVTAILVSAIFLLIGVALNYVVPGKVFTYVTSVATFGADFPYAVKELIKDSHSKGKYTDEYLYNMKYTCSTFIMYLGLNKKYPNLSAHNIYIDKEFKKNIEDAFVGNIPDNPPMYIYCPSRIDKTMASNNKECLSIIVRVPNLLFDNVKWDKNTMDTLRLRILKNLKNIKGLEDIDEHIEYESYLTPEDLHNRFNSYGGTAFGISPTLSQTNYFRPHIKSDNVDNLYFVGSSVHPGSGVSIVLLSSELVTEEILKNS